MNIAITGKMRAGKTTLADILVEQHGYEKMSLANPLKLLGKDALNLVVYELNAVLEDIAPEREPIKQLTKEQLETDKHVFRVFWQWLGTNFCRRYLGWDDIWIAVLQAWMKSATKPVVIDDVRFLNEAQTLKEQDFTIVRLIRTGVLDDSRLQLGSESESHVSETELEAISYDHRLECSDIDCLREAADSLADSHFRSRAA